MNTFCEEQDFDSIIDQIPTSTLKKELKKRENGNAYKAFITDILEYISYLPDWAFREFMCDVLGLSYMTTKEEIIKKLKEKL